MIPVDQYNRRAAIVRAVQSGVNQFNEAVTSLNRQGELYAKRTDLRDSEKAAAGAEAAQLWARFTVRRTALSRSITAHDRLVFGAVFDGNDELQSGEVWRVEGVKFARESGDLEIEITAVRDPLGQSQEGLL